MPRLILVPPSRTTMKIFARLPLALVYLCFVAAIGVSNSVRAGSATWDLNPGSGDWNTATNWTPATAPNGSADTATFATSNTTAISISANTTVDGITFAPGASSFTITASPGFTLTLNGVGITNDSGTIQNFVAAPSGGSANAIRLFFKNSATAGSGTFFTMNGGATLGGTPGWTLFDDSSSAGHGTFTNNGPTVQGTFGEGATIFNKSATASNGTFINNGGTVGSQFGGDQGLTAFNDTSTAANGIFTNNAGTVSGAHGGTTAFSSSATAANATITNYGATVNDASGGVTSFSGLFGTATAGNATIINNGGNVSGASGGKTSFEGFFEIVSPGRRFFGSSTAGNATIINNGGDVSGAGGGETVFFTDFNSSNPLGASTAGDATLIANGGTRGGQGGAILFKDFSTGGTSRIEVFGNGRLDISPHSAPGVTIGSIEGSGNVFLGRNNLTVGSKNLTTIFSGVIQDGGANAGSGGSLTKIGSGTLVLAGANTYTGNTNINSGVLQVDGSITSNTFVNHGGTLAGAGTVIGNVTNNRGGTASPGDAAGMLTVNSYAQMSGSTLQIEIAGPNTGQFSVLDVLGNATINPNGLLDPVLQDGFVPTVGESFTFMDYAALSGTFFIFDRNIDNAIEHWDVTYQSKYAILTVAPGNVPVADQGPTLLLLTLSFLFLLMCRYLFLRKQACI
jgi:autotransporter-associated beta strand protein